ncbi:MAG TPA: peptidoglycan DD-metalloendopeptidase family protein [Bacilli bacterium]
MINRKRRRNKLTLVMIREANKPVWHKDVGKWTPWALFASVSIAVIAASLWVFSMRSQYNQHIRLLSSQIQQEKKQRQEIVGEKNEMIGQLQNQIVMLGEEANAVKAKLQEIERLEQELRNLSGQSQNLGADAPKSGAAATAEGGEWHDVTASAMESYSNSIKDEYVRLDEQMRQLSQELSEHKKALDEQIALQRVSPSIWPTVSRIVTSGYGVRRDPFTNQPGYHNGIDIGGNIGDPVMATADGTVEFVGADKTHGNYIIIDHGQGIKTEYLHLKSIRARKGEKVAKGETIGTLGNTGRSTGPHLHYQVIKSGEDVNPEHYLPH